MTHITVARTGIEEIERSHHCTKSHVLRLPQMNQLYPVNVRLLSHFPPSLIHFPYFKPRWFRLPFLVVTSGPKLASSVCPQSNPVPRTNPNSLFVPQQIPLSFLPDDPHPTHITLSLSLFVPLLDYLSPFSSGSIHSLLVHKSCPSKTFNLMEQDQGILQEQEQGTKRGWIYLNLLFSVDRNLFARNRKNQERKHRQRLGKGMKREEERGE